MKIWVHLGALNFPLKYFIAIIACQEMEIKSKGNFDILKRDLLDLNLQNLFKRLASKMNSSVILTCYADLTALVSHCNDQIYSCVVSFWGVIV